MSIPTPYTVDLLPYTEGSKDARGRGAELFGPPVPVAVHGWYSVAADELELLAPSGFPGKGLDQMVVDGDTYTIEGNPKAFNHSPFGNEVGGLVVALRKEPG